MNELIKVINDHSVAFEVKIVSGGCSNDRLFMMERCIGGDFLEVFPPELNDAAYTKAPIAYLLFVDVLVRQARPDYEHRTWRWKPEQIVKGRVGFAHTDYEQLLTYASNWLLDHSDPKTYTEFKGRTVNGIKCEPIGRLKHYTTMEEFANGEWE